MLFPLLFQLTVQDPTQTVQNIQISRLTYTERQLQDRQVNFIRGNQLLITIPLNQFDSHGDQQCLSASVPRSLISARFASVAEVERPAAIYNWLFNMRSSILSAYNAMSDHSHSTFNFDLSTVPITQATPPPAPPVVAPIAPTVAVVQPQAPPVVVAPPQLHGPGAIDPRLGPDRGVGTRSTAQLVPQQVTPEQRETYFASVISTYSGYIREALRQNPNDRQRIEQNYRTIFYGPSEERMHGNICLADQIQYDRILSAGMKQFLLQSMENLITRTPAPVVAPVVVPTRAAPAQTALFTQQDAINLYNMLTTPGRLDPPLSGTLAREVVAGFNSLSTLPHFTDVWTDQERARLPTFHYSRRDVVGLIGQIVAVVGAPSPLLAEANRLSLAISTLADSERTEIRAALGRSDFGPSQVTAIDNLLFDISRNGLAFRRAFSISNLLEFVAADPVTSQTRVVNYVRQVLRGSDLDPQSPLRTSGATTLDQISLSIHQYALASLSMFLSEPRAADSNRPLFTVNELYPIFDVVRSLNLADAQITSLRGAAEENGRNGVFDTLARLAGSNTRAVSEIRRLRNLPREEFRPVVTAPLPTPPVAPSTVTAPATTRSAAVVAMVNAVISEANPASLITNHNYPESEVLAASVAIYQDLMLPATSGPLAERFRAFVGSQRPRNDDERRRLLLQFYQRQHDAISRDLPALWTAFGHRSSYYPPGSGVPEFIAALALINWRLSHPNLSEYPAGRWDLQAPMQVAPPQVTAPTPSTTSTLLSPLQRTAIRSALRGGRLRFDERETTEIMGILTDMSTRSTFRSDWPNIPNFGSNGNSKTVFFAWLRQMAHGDTILLEHIDQLNPPRTAPTPPVVTPAESGGDLLAGDSEQVTRARLVRSEQQIYDDVIRGNVSAVLRASIPAGRAETIFRALIHDSGLNGSFGISETSVVAVQGEILAEQTIAADLPDLWVRSRLPPLTANGEANIQTLAALALFRWRELHPATATRAAPVVGSWDPNFRPSAPVVNAPPVTPAPSVVVPVAATTTTTGGVLTQQQNDMLLDVIVGSNLADRTPRFVRLYRNITQVTSNPELVAEQLYYFYTNQIVNNDHYRIERIGQVSPTSDAIHRAHNYLLASGSTPETANNFSGYRTMLLNALVSIVQYDGSPQELRDGQRTGRRLGDPIVTLNQEVSTLLTRAGFNPSFLALGANAQTLQAVPFEAIVLAISYVEWRVHNRTSSVDFNTWIPQAGVNVAARPVQPPVVVPAPPTTGPVIDSNLVRDLTQQVTDLHTAVDAVQTTRNQIAAQLTLGRAAVTNRDQIALDAAKAEVTRLLRTLSGYEGTDGAVEEANREINRLLPRTDSRRSAAPYQQLIGQATGFGSQVASLIGAARGDQTTINALVITADPGAVRASAQQTYDQAKRNLDTAIASFRNDVAYCRDQLAAARTASNANNLADFTAAQTNFNNRLGVLRGSENLADSQVTLGDLRSLMTALRSANDRLNEFDSSGRRRRVDELNGYTRTINGGPGSFESTLNSYESDLRRLRVPVAPSVVAPPLSAADQVRLRELDRLGGTGPSGGPVGDLRMRNDPNQSSVSGTPTYQTIETGATFGTAALATNTDGRIVGSGSRDNPYVIDVPIRWPGHDEVVNILTEQELYGRRYNIRFQFRAVESTTQVTQNSLSQSITTAFNTLVREIRPPAVVSPPTVRENVVRSVSLRPLLQAHPEIEAQFARR